MKSAFTLITLSLILLSSLRAAEPVVGISDMAEDGSLLVNISADQPGRGSYSSLFVVNLEDGDRIDTLTYFPEISSYFPETGELEIQNRFGLYRLTPGRSTRLREMPFYPSITENKYPSDGRILPVSSSPDGKWVLQQEADGPVRCRYVVYGSTGSEGSEGLVLSRNQIISLQDKPALWSPDSRYLIYSDKGRIYYVSSLQIESGRLPDSRFREIGRGTLSNIRWTSPDSLYYLRGRELLLLRPSEIFTRAFYSEPLPPGTVAGVIPIDFDPNSDKFWPSPDGSSIIILKGSRNLFYFKLNNTQETANLPFMHFTGGETVQQLWWSPGGHAFFIAGGELSTLDENTGGFIQISDLSDIRKIVPSDDGRFLALLQPPGISILDTDTMEELSFIEHTDPLDLFWMDSSSLLIAGGLRTELASVNGTEKTVLTLSQIDKAGYDSRGTLVAFSGVSSYTYLPESDNWIENHDMKTLRTPVLETEADRVFIEDNSIIVRSISGFGNRSLFEHHYPDIKDPVSPEDSDQRVFSHGSRTRGRTISLVFNAIDNDEGFNDVLRVLRDYNIRATFFIGGDFIRRNPESAVLLAASRNEIGSLFYTQMDMTDFRYSIDKNFIVRGLGRNEDSFFNETGREVSTLWHAPWYVVSPPILEATREMNYLYVGRDIDPLDWVVSDGSAGNSALYLRSSELLERVLDEVKPGSIIPIRIGRPGEREDYFFRKLDLLINALLNEGYEIVTVSELKKRMN